MTSDSRGAAAVRGIDQAKALRVSPVYLAGEDRSGAARVVYPLRDDFGWSVGSTGVANVVLDSPCRRARIGYLPTHPVYTSLWVVGVAIAPLHPFAWTAGFSHGTPGEIVAAFAKALTYDLAGGGRDALLDDRDLDLVVAPLLQVGWRTTHSYVGPEDEGEGEATEGLGIRYVSPDGLARARWFDSKADEGADPSVNRREGWDLGAGLPGAGWGAAFSAEVPDHLVAAVTRRLAAVRPVFRDERELVPELREHLIVSPSLP
ncbi:DUF317 domain-containing protein [Streptomyces hygroscopicus]|uniref:DUF317 domain-containing protein n=1 Tax=Streptomyces hygroscopicus TaxID=1912 RepID=UPI0007676ABD|nr:DUF317 domain-containing protein [Streptomyces hygroscopicus]